MNHRVTNGNLITMPPVTSTTTTATIMSDKTKDWQLEILMEKLRSKASQYKSLQEISKNVRMAMLDKRYVLDSVEKSQHQKCLDTLQHSIKVTSLQSMIERLESLTRQLGLKFMVGPSGVELFISSDMFYLEIVLDQNGIVKDVKVHHDSKMEQQSCSDLVDCLSRGDFIDFTQQLEGFTSIYQLNAEKKIKCKAFTALQSLESDLCTLAQLQSFMKEPMNLLHKSPVGILEKRRGGHPMKLTYFLSPYDLINIEKYDIEPLTTNIIINKSLGYSCTVCMESSETHKLQTTTLITVNRSVNGKSTPSFSPLNNQNSAAIPACFILKLNKPMPMCLQLIKQIQQLTEMENILEKTTNKYPLLNLIVHHSSDGKMQSGNNRGLFVTLPDQNHCYFMTENKNMDGIIVNSIPFTHPAHVSQILVILRQQALFNTIISSCVRPNSKQDFDNMTMFEINALSWTHISISLEHPIEECMATADIDLNDITNLLCKIRSPGTPPPPNTPDIISDLSTKILNRSFSIPITMRTVIKQWEKQYQRRINNNNIFNNNNNNSNNNNNNGNGNENFSLPLGSGDPGGQSNNNNTGNNTGTTEFGGLDTKIKQEPVMQQSQQQSSEANFQNFPPSEGILTNMELTQILSGNTTPPLIINDNKKSKNNTNNGGNNNSNNKRKNDDLWKVNNTTGTTITTTKQRKVGLNNNDNDDILVETSSSDSTSRSTPISTIHDNDISTTTTTTSNSGLGFQSDLELTSLDTIELISSSGGNGNNTSSSSTTTSSSISPVDNKNINNNNSDSCTEFGNSLDDLNDVEEILSSGTLKKKISRDRKSSPQTITTILDLGDNKNLVPPSVSITPINQTINSSNNTNNNQNTNGNNHNNNNNNSGGSGNNNNSNNNDNKRPGIEIIPLSTTVPSSITITPITSKSDDKNRSSSSSSSDKKSGSSSSSKSRSSSDDKNRLEKKRKRKRDESPMGPPEKIPPKQQQQQDPLSKPISVSIKPAESPPLLNNNNNNSIGGNSCGNTTPSSPNMLRKFNTSPSLSGKLSPNLIKTTKSTNCTNSGSHNSPKHSPVHITNSPKHISSPKHHGTSPKHQSTTTSGNSGGKPSMSQLKNVTNSSSSSSSPSSSNKSNNNGGSGGDLKKNVSKDLSSKDKKVSIFNSNGNNSKKSVKMKPLDLNCELVNVQDGLPSPSGSSSLLPTTTTTSVTVITTTTITDLTKSNQVRNRKGSLSAIVDKLKSAQHNDIIDLNKTNNSGNNNGGNNGNNKGGLKNSEYMVKPSSDGMKLTINKTRSKDNSGGNNNNNTINNKNNNLNKLGGSPKTHTGLKPGVNSGPASKKPQNLTTSTTTNTTTGQKLSNLTNNYLKNINKLNNNNNYKLNTIKPLTKSVTTPNNNIINNNTSTNNNNSNNNNKVKLNKSNSDKSIFTTKDGRKSSPTTHQQDDYNNKLNKIDPYTTGSLMMEGLMKQLDKNFQIPKLSARSSNNNNNNPTTSTTTTTTSTITTTTTTIVDDKKMGNTNLVKLPLSGDNNGNKFDNSIDKKNSIASTSSLKIDDDDDDDDIDNEQTINYPLVKNYPNEPLSLTKTIDLTTKFLTPPPLKDDTIIINKKDDNISTNKKNDDCLLDLVNKNQYIQPLMTTQQQLALPAPPQLPTLPQPSQSPHLIKSPQQSPIINPSPHSTTTTTTTTSPCITDDELMDEALIGLSK